MLKVSKVSHCVLIRIHIEAHLCTYTSLYVVIDVFGTDIEVLHIDILSHDFDVLILWLSAFGPVFGHFRF